MLKGCGTHCIGEENHQTVLSDNYSRHLYSSKVSPPIALSEGQLFSYQINGGFHIQGGKTHELVDFQVLSTAQKSLMIVILLEGKLEFGYDSLNFKLDADHSAHGVLVSLNKPVSFHRQLYADNYVTKLNITLPFDWIEQRCGDNEPVHTFLKVHLAHFTLRLDERALAITQELLKLSSPINLIQKMQVESLTLALFIDLFKQLTEKQCLDTEYLDSVQNSHVKSHFDHRIDPLIAYIESHISEPISVQTLSDVSAMSASSLQRKFKDVLGCSVNSYIRRRRLEIAKQQLERGTISITEAAYSAGYRHPSNFTNAFKKHFGYPPTDSINHKKY